MMISALCSSTALALPVHEQTVSGTVNLAHPDAQTLNIQQQGDKAIVNWQSFDIGQGEAVHVSQPSNQSILLNRVLGDDPSEILGQLDANGHVWLMNPNGVMFGEGAQVDVGGLLATTADIENADFLNGHYRFDQAGASDGFILNEGALNAEGGVVALLAPQVTNRGTIQANFGRVQMSAAETFTVDFSGDGLINIALDEASGTGTKALKVVNAGDVIADAGRVEMSVAQGNALVERTLDHNWGVVRADSVGKNNAGQIVLGGGSLATTTVNAQISAKGEQAGETGGRVNVTGQNITLKENATIDASGRAGGGTVRVGGEYKGGGDTPRAQHTTMASTARIDVSATGHGNGGEAIVWADEHTDFAGAITAHGGSKSGDGGFVETSGKQHLSVRSGASVRAAAPHGKNGKWLLDPNNVTISNGGAADVSGGGTINPNTTNYTIDRDTLQTALDTPLDVEITTDQSGGGGGQVGDITLADALSWTGSGSLTLTADNDINLNATITSTNAGANLTLDAGGDGAGNININAGSTISIAGNLAATATGGTITVGADVDTNGGNLTFNSGAALANGTRIIESGTGTLSIGVLAAGANNLSLLGDEITLGGNITGTGNITLSTGTTTTPIQLGSNAAAASLNLTDAELDFIQNGFTTFTIGADSNSAGINIDGAIDSNGRTANWVLKTYGDINFNANMVATDSTGYVWIDTSQSEASYSNGSIVDGGGAILLNGAGLLLTGNSVGTSTDFLEVRGATEIAGGFRSGYFAVNNNTTVSDMEIGTVNGIVGVQAKNTGNQDQGFFIYNDTGSITVTQPAISYHNGRNSVLKANGLLQIDNTVRSHNLELHADSYDINVAVVSDTPSGSRLRVVPYDVTDTLGIGDNTAIIAGVDVVFNNEALTNSGDFEQIDFGGQGGSIGIGLSGELYIDVGAYTFDKSVEVSQYDQANSNSTSIYINSDINITMAGGTFTTDSHTFATRNTNLVFNNGSDIITNNGNITIDGNVNLVTLNDSSVMNAGTGTVSISAPVTAGANNFSLYGDEIDIGANITGTGAITLSTGSTGTAIQLGSVATAAALNLTDAELDFIQDGISTLTIGADTNLGGITIDGAIDNNSRTNSLILKSQGQITLNANLDATGSTGYVWLDTSENNVDYTNGYIVDGGGVILLDGAGLLMTATGVGSVTDPIEVRGATQIAGAFRGGGYFLENNTTVSDIEVGTVNGISGLVAQSAASVDDGFQIQNDTGGVTITQPLISYHSNEVGYVYVNGLLKIDNTLRAHHLELFADSYDINTALVSSNPTSSYIRIRGYDHTDTLGIGDNTAGIAGVDVVFNNEALTNTGNFSSLDFGGQGTSLAFGLDADLYIDVGAYTFDKSVEVSVNDDAVAANANSIFIENDIIITSAGSTFSTDSHSFGIRQANLVFNNGADIITNNGNIYIIDEINATTINGDTTFNSGAGTVSIGDGGINVGANNFTVIADEFVLDGDLDGSGNLVIRPSTNNTTISLNDGNTAGLDFSLAELGRIGATTDFSSITIGGSAHTGTMNVGDWTAESPLTLRAGSLNLDGDIDVGARTLNVTANTGNIAYTSGTLTADTLNLSSAGTMAADVAVTTALDIGASATGATLTGLFKAGNGQAEADDMTGAAADGTLTYSFNATNVIGGTVSGGGDTGGPSTVDPILPPALDPVTDSDTDTDTDQGTDSGGGSGSGNDVSSGGGGSGTGGQSNDNLTQNVDKTITQSETIGSNIVVLEPYTPEEITIPTFDDYQDFSDGIFDVSGDAITNYSFGSIQEGTAVIFDNNSFNTISSGYVPSVGDHIFTGLDFGFSFMFDENSIISMTRNSEMKVRRTLYSPDGKSAEYFDIKKGAVGFFSDRNKHKGEIKTILPGVAIKVTGTCYIVDFDDKTQRTDITLFGGGIELFIKGQLIKLKHPIQKISFDGKTPTGEGNVVPVKIDMRDVRNQFKDRPEVIPSRDQLLKCGVEPADIDV